MTPALLSLALMVCGEAVGDPASQVAVAQVALARVADPRWPGSLEEVISEPGQFHSAPARWRVMTHPAFERCLDSAWVAERLGPGPFNHFAVVGSGEPEWYAWPSFVIGLHEFWAR